MPDKQKSAQRSRKSKTSQGMARGASKFPGGGMTQLQKVLMVNGGMAHQKLRKGQTVADRLRSDRRS